MTPAPKMPHRKWYLFYSNERSSLEKTAQERDTCMKQKDDLKNKRFAGYRAAQHLFEDALQDLCDEDERYILCYYDNYYSKKSVTEKDMTKPLAALFGPLLRDGIR